MYKRKKILIRPILVITMIVSSHVIKAQLPTFHLEFPTVLYAGMDNPIPIRLHGTDPELVNCKVSQAQRVTKYNDSLYAVYPAGVENKAMIKLYYKNIIVEQKQLEVLPPLQIRLSFSQEGNGFIKRKALLAEEGFALVSMEGGKTDGLNFRLISAGVTIFAPTGQVLFSSNLRDSHFNQQVMDQFKSIPEGSRLAVSNPRVINQYNQSVNTEPYREWIILE